MGTRIEETALTYAHMTKAVIEARDQVANFKISIERAGRSAPILGQRFAITEALEAVLLEILHQRVREAIENQAAASRKLDEAAGIKAPKP
jgi:DNA-binding FrmR family transcriptional regulator